jgi:hypothetical protein
MREASIIIIFVVTVMASISITVFINRGDNQGLIRTIVTEILITSFFSWLYWIFSSHEFVTSLSALQKLLADYAVDGRGTYLLNRDDEWLKRNADDIIQILANVLRESEAEDVNSDTSKRRRAVFKNAHAICFEFGLCEKNQEKWLPKNPPLKVAVPTEATAAATVATA